MARDTKFGTFGGVFTPSILTILGVIMYMRLPWVVGNAGLSLGVGIILVAHVISVTTGLSISSIATDKRVGAGGPYYIVSRSLGLPIGGTLGLALFLGIAFSISLYVIGFSESFLSFWQIGLSPETGAPTLNAIRICGTLTIIALTVVTFVSTSLAIKTQYLILVAIVLSLGSIVFGSVETANLGPSATTVGDVSVGTLFGIFFPAVTGFTAGVNMSGDLRDPNRSIPRGTMAAIFVGLVVYVALALFVSLRIPADKLVGNPTILVDVAWSPHLVVAGIWGATLSSALGSILGAPRILQAVASDRIAPRFLAKGHGPGNEPRNALLLAFAIGEAGILVAQLDVIAAVVSMVFLATYGFLNVSCAIESWASPDFRPQFRIPKLVPLVGAVVTVLIMIQIDIVSMLAAAVGMTALFSYLKRRQLTLETGDTWESMWASLVRAGLTRLGRAPKHQRNWRPNIMSFSLPGQEKDGALHSLGRTLVGAGGVLTRFDLAAPGDERADVDPPQEDDFSRQGVFVRRVTTSTPLQTMAAICEHHGYPALPPNTVFFDWSAHADDDALPELLSVVDRRDLNVLWVAERAARRDEEQERVDFWWAAGRGNLPFTITMGRFLTAAGAWRNASLRFLLVADERTDTHALMTSTRRMLQASRVDGEVKLVRAGLHGWSFAETVTHESAGAALTVLGIGDAGDEQERARIRQMLAFLGTTVLFRASSTFEDIGGTVQTVARAKLRSIADDGSDTQLPPLRRPAPIELAREAARFDEAYTALVMAFHAGAVVTTSAQTVSLLRSLAGVIRKQLEQLESAIDAVDSRRHRKAAARAEGAVLFHCQRLLSSFNATDLSQQAAVLEGHIHDFLRGCTAFRRRTPGVLTAHRELREFRSDPDDTRYLDRYKRWQRIKGMLLRRPLEVRVDVEPLAAYHIECGMEALLEGGVRQVHADHHRIAIGLSKVLGSLPGALAALRTEREAGHSLAPYIAQERARLLEGLEALERLARQQVRDNAAALRVQSRRVAQGYADDLDRLDLPRRVKTDRKPGKKEPTIRPALIESSQRWAATQKLLLEQTATDLQVAGAQFRVSSLTQRLRETILSQMRSGTLRKCADLTAALQAYRDALAGEPIPLPAPELEETIDVRRMVEELMEDTGRAVVQLPETSVRLTDDALRELEGGEAKRVEEAVVPLRRSVQFILESEFLAGIQEALTRIPMAERRSASVAEEVLQLIAFQQSDLEADEELSSDARRELIGPVVDDGLGRLSAEIADLETACDTLRESLDAQVAEFVRRTEPYQLAGMTESTGRRTHVGDRRSAVPSLRKVQERVTSIASRAMVTVLYRRSSGALAARQLGSGAARTDRIVGQLLRLVDEHVPRSTVFEALPFYYRQLFLGQTRINESFWVGRQRELVKAEEAIQAFRRGTRGALVVTGEGGSGKSALCNVIATRFFDPSKVHRVLPSRGGSCQPSVFRAALERGVQRQGSPEQVVQALPRGSVVVIDDLELWWERSEQGLETLECIVSLIETCGDRCFFILGINTQAFLFINRLVGLAGLALAVLECGPLDAEALKSVVLTRHRSTGRKLRVGKRSEESLSEWRIARLFNSFFDESRGNVAAGLLAWIAHIDSVEGDVLTIRPPEVADYRLLDQLRPEWSALLIQLVLHKQLTFSRLERITRLDPLRLRAQLAVLLRTGLVVESRQGVIELNRYLHHRVIESLTRRGYLA